MTPPALNFLVCFVGPIRRGVKHCTIRALGKRQFTVGDPLYLYCKMRHPGCFRIVAEPVTCTKVQPVEIRPGAVILGGAELTRPRAERLARACGMQNLEQFFRYWQPMIPFHGHAIWWDPPLSKRRAP